MWISCQVESTLNQIWKRQMRLLAILAQVQMMYAEEVWVAATFQKAVQRFRPDPQHPQASSPNCATWAASDPALGKTWAKSARTAGWRQGNFGYLWKLYYVQWLIYTIINVCSFHIAFMQEVLELFCTSPVLMTIVCQNAKGLGQSQSLACRDYLIIFWYCNIILINFYHHSWVRDSFGSFKSLRFRCQDFTLWIGSRGFGGVATLTFHDLSWKKWKAANYVVAIVAPNLYLGMFKYGCLLIIVTVRNALQSSSTMDQLQACYSRLRTRMWPKTGNKLSNSHLLRGVRAVSPRRTTSTWSYNPAIDCLKGNCGSLTLARKVILLLSDAAKEPHAKIIA